MKGFLETLDRDEHRLAHPLRRGPFEQREDPMEG